MFGISLHSSTAARLSLCASCLRNRPYGATTLDHPRHITSLPKKATKRRGQKNADSPTTTLSKADTSAGIAHTQQPPPSVSPEKDAVKNASPATEAPPSNLSRQPKKKKGVPNFVPKPEPSGRTPVSIQTGSRGTRRAVPQRHSLKIKHAPSSAFKGKSLISYRSSTTPPDALRVMAKAQILHFNEYGGLTDEDKLRIMEQVRRSMEDKAVAAAISFTKPQRRKSSSLPKSPHSKEVPSGSQKTSKDTTSEPPRSLQPMKKSSSLDAYEIQTIKARKLVLLPLENPQPPVPKLAYGLERVLFNPGVYHLRDPRSRVFNFDPYLQSIMPVDDFDFSALKKYITSSQDQNLIATAEAEKKKYTGSTSSMTSVLQHFHFLLSQWRPINVSSLSKGFPDEFHTFTGLQRAPTAVFLRWKNGTYAIDADKQYDSANILMMLGKSMEKLLTLPKGEFEKYKKMNSYQISHEERNEAESFHYSTIGDFLLRSQLDAYDSRLPGTGMFDLKTRAVVSIRMDARNYEKGSGYEIRQRYGEYESYEREYYDMIRSAFLKYSLQVRMGRMDGIFVAFHNTERIFGFQYISLPEMDFALHGSADTTIGDSEFKVSLELLNKVLDRASAKYPEQSLRLFFETRPGKAPFMYIFAEPVSEDQINTIQASNKSEIDEFEKRVLNLQDTEPEQAAQDGWDHLQAVVEREIEHDEQSSDASSDDLNKYVDSRDDNEDNSDVRAWVDKVISGLDRTENENATSEDEFENEFITGPESNSVEENNSMDRLDKSRPGINSTQLEDGSASAIDEDGTQDAAEADLSKDGLRLMEETKLFSDVKDLNQTLLHAHKPSIKHPDNLTRQASDEAPGEIKNKFHEQISQENGSQPREVPRDEATPKDVKTKSRQSKAQSISKEVLAMVLTIRNKVKEQYVERPNNLAPNSAWDVEYALAEVPEFTKALDLYTKCQIRRRRALQDQSKKSSDFVNGYMKKLHGLSQRGRSWRRKQDEIDQEGPFEVLDPDDNGDDDDHREQ